MKVICESGAVAGNLVGHVVHFAIGIIRVSQSFSSWKIGPLAHFAEAVSEDGDSVGIVATWRIDGRGVKLGLLCTHSWKCSSYYSATFLTFPVTFLTAKVSGLRVQVYVIHY